MKERHTCHDSGLYLSPSLGCGDPVTSDSSDVRSVRSDGRRKKSSLDGRESVSVRSVRRRCAVSETSEKSENGRGYCESVRSVCCHWTRTLVLIVGRQSWS